MLRLCPRLVFADGTQSIYLADLSGDGLTDLVRIRAVRSATGPTSAMETDLLPDTVLPFDLTLEEEREACRVLKGAMLLAVRGAHLAN